MFRLAEFIFTLLLGFASGFASGAFGIGGGVITTPAIRLLLQQPAGIALGTPLPVIFPSALVGGFNYWRAGKINLRVVAYCSLFGVAGTVLGSGLTAFMDTRYIMIVTALLIFYLSWRTASAALGKELYACPEDGPEGGGSEAWKLALIGLMTGFFSGFLGLGGGVIMVPAFFFLLRLDLKECLGNSLVVIAFLAVPGTVIHALLGHIDWLIALAMILGVMPGSYAGSFFTLRARDRRVLTLFAALLAAVGIIFLLKEVSGLT